MRIALGILLGLLIGGGLYFHRNYEVMVVNPDDEQILCVNPLDQSVIMMAGDSDDMDAMPFLWVKLKDPAGQDFDITATKTPAPPVDPGNWMQVHCEIVGRTESGEALKKKRDEQISDYERQPI
jgi:hypothetical protein